MCDPTTAAILSAVGTVSQGYAAMQQGKYEQGVANYNARLAENEAQRERNIGTEEENKQRRAAAEMLSQQRAQIGASGVDISSGSAMNLQQDTITLAEVDARRIRTNYDYAYQAKQNEAKLQRAQGKAAAQAGRNAFMGSLLTAGGTFMGSEAGQSLSKKWFTPKSQGMAMGGRGSTTFVPMSDYNTYRAGFTSGAGIGR